MGQGQDSSRLTLARVNKLADEIKTVGQRAHEVGNNQFDRGFSYAGMCGGLESVIEHLVRDACGEEARALIEAAFRDAYAPRVATPEQAAQVAA